MGNLSIKRMVSLYKKFWAEDKKTTYILIGILVIVGALLVFFTDNLSFKEGTCVGVVLGICIVMAIKTFQFRNNSDRQHYLLIPASTGEKLITSLVDVHIIQPLLCIILLSLELGLGAMFRGIIGWNPTYNIGALTVAGNFLHYTICNIDFILGIILAQAIFIFGNLYFKTRGWLKTIFYSTIFIIVLFTIDGIIINNSIISYVKLSVLSDYEWSLFIGKTYTAIKYILLCLLIIIFWVMSYFSLRETEV